MIDSDRLASFRVFAEELSFTRAAARLHVSQPALHVKVGKLADSLGVELYRRVGRALSLTTAGEALLAHARDREREDQAFLAALGQPTPATVVLAAGEGTLLYVLGDAVRQVAGRRDVDVRVLTRDRDGVLAALRRGEAHVGVTAAASAPDDLASTRLRAVGMVAVVARGHRLARRRTVRLRDLDGERLIVPPAGRPHRDHVERALDDAGVTWERAVEATGWALMLHYAGLGVGVAIVNDTCRIPRGAVARPVPELARLPYWALHRRGLAVDDPAADLLARIVDAFRAAAQPGARRRAAPLSSRGGRRRSPWAG